MTRFRLTFAAVISLIALRVIIGWHFYQEGIAKLQGEPFSTGALFQGAKGPLARLYQQPVWDPYGEARLDRGRTESIWAKYRDRLIKSPGIDKQAKQEFQRIEASHRRRLRAFFDEIRADLPEYMHNVKRLKAYQRDPSRQDVPGLRKQVGSIEKKIKQKSTPWLAEIDSIWNDFEADMQRFYLDTTGKSASALSRPARRWYDTKTIDLVVPYFDTILGVLLILGLFTRIAAWSGSIFLATIVASQWPGTPETIPTYYQAIECLALVTVATTGAGRFGALDVIVGRIWSRIRRRKGEAKA